MFDIAVLGCGWAGVVATSRLAGHDVVCLEKEGKPGGLLRTESVGGFTIDVGRSHVIFSKREDVLREMLALLGGNVVKNARSSYVLLEEGLVPYPLENGLYVLPPEERAEALVSFLEAWMSLDRDWQPRNLYEWIHHFFGRWLAKKYLEPYNQKIWKRPLDQIDVDWVYTPGRLPVPDWRDVARAAAGVPTVGYREQSVFYYPAEGGIEALFQAALQRAEGLRVLTNTKVDRVEKAGGGFLINGRVEARHIVSTIPLPELLRSLGDGGLGEYADKFDYNKVVAVAVALRRPGPRQHWVYVPDPQVVFHRYAWLSNYSPHNAPQGHSLVLAEITVPRGEDVPRDFEERAVRDFVRLGVFEEGDVLFVKSWVHEYGYPIHTLELREVRNAVLSELRKIGITPIGRWGTWRYLNMDMVYKEIRELNI